MGDVINAFGQTPNDILDEAKSEGYEDLLIIGRNSDGALNFRCSPMTVHKMLYLSQLCSHKILNGEIE